jgi:hypothetical protein
MVERIERRGSASAFPWLVLAVFLCVAQDECDKAKECNEKCCHCLCVLEVGKYVLVVVNWFFCCGLFGARLWCRSFPAFYAGRAL